jgi:hypothetical protein
MHWHEQGSDLAGNATGSPLVTLAGIRRIAGEIGAAMT